jgi:hypothetical protein
MGTDRTIPPGHRDPSPGWYLAALVGYVIAGFFLKSVLLNWVVGPLFLLIVLYLVPTWLRRWSGRPRVEPVE